MENASKKWGLTHTLLSGIARSLRIRGTMAQRLMTLLLMALLSLCALPGGVYVCQTAMFAVLVRLGFCVPAAFAGVIAGFAMAFGRQDVFALWQLPAAAALWLLCGLWAGRHSRAGMSAAAAAAVLLAAASADLHSPAALAALGLSAVCAGALALLYDGAALCFCRRDELEGEARPLCAAAVFASIAAACVPLPFGASIAMALAAYLTAEHAHTGGLAQAILCGGVVGAVLAACVRRVEPCAMLLCGGFCAGAVRTRSRSLCAGLMLFGMASCGALLGGVKATLPMLLCAAGGMLPLVLLPARFRAPVTGMIERDEPQALSQSGAIALRHASLLNAWADVYDEMAKLMQGALADDAQRVDAAQCAALLRRTGEAARTLCARQCSLTCPDDDAYRALRFALLRAGREAERPVYALRTAGRLEVLLEISIGVSPDALEALVSSACGVSMRACGILSPTQALYEQTPPLALEIGAALRSRSGEEVAGDQYLSRRLSGGRHILALSDGMGSGERAMVHSHAALSLLLSGMKAGFTREQALCVVNELMLMCTGREMYATMDLCEIDLHTGEAAFEKLGASAAYVIRGGEVRALGADTLPMGVLPDVRSGSLHMKLLEGDVVVMLTDGVSQGYPGGEEALRTALGQLCWLHPRALGERLIELALGGGQPRDDMAVLCARVSRQPGAALLTQHGIF